MENNDNAKEMKKTEIEESRKEQVKQEKKQNGALNDEEREE